MTLEDRLAFNDRIRRAGCAGSQSYALHLEQRVAALGEALAALVIDVEDFGEPRRHYTALKRAAEALKQTEDNDD